jgi:hypothetical protein
MQGQQEVRMRARFGLIIAVLALIASAGPLAAQSPPPPIVKTEGLRQISSHVHIIPDNQVPLVPNVGYVVGERAVLVIDTGLGPRNGAAVYEIAKKLGGTKALYLVTTHVHPEHDLGAQSFPATTRLIRSRDQVRTSPSSACSSRTFLPSAPRSMPSCSRARPSARRTSRSSTTTTSISAACTPS